MPTRLKRPAIWRPLALTVALLGFQGYLGFSAIGGQFGIESRTQILLDIDQLKAKSSALQAEIVGRLVELDEMHPTTLH